MLNSVFLRDLVERALATAAQALIAILAADGFDLLSANWVGIVSVVGTATALSVLKAVAARGKGDLDHVSPASLAKDGRVVSGK